jgi:Domain of unknown function (DUF4136)
MMRLELASFMCCRKQGRMGHSRKTPSRSKSLTYLILMLLLAAFPALAKIDVDFDPNVDTSKYKSFAFVGGVKNLVMLPVDPDVLDIQIHHLVTRELTKKGLREVQPGQNPDLVVRYWANTSQQVNPMNMGDWGPYNAYIGSYWAPMYDAVSASSGKENTVLIDLIDPRSKNLAWRLYLTRKFSNADKDWKKADEEFAKAFESYPPSEKEKEAKRKERAAYSAKNSQP